MTGLAPVTEEDKAAVMSMIRRTVRLRKRVAANSTNPTYATEDLTKSIEGLHTFGATKGWWEYEAEFV